MQSNVNYLICCINIIKSIFARLTRYISLVRYLQNPCYKRTSSIYLKCKVIILFMRVRKLSRQKILSYCRFAFKFDFILKNKLFFLFCVSFILNSSRNSLFSKSYCRSEFITTVFQTWSCLSSYLSNPAKFSVLLINKKLKCACRCM